MPVRVDAVADSVWSAAYVSGSARQRARLPIGLAGTVAAAVALAGAGGAAGCHRRPAAPTPAAASARTPELRSAGVQDLLQLVRAPGAKAVVVNVWATWCVPCREELPDLLRVEREYRSRGLRLLLVSADLDSSAGAARVFLARHGVAFQTYLKTGADMEFIDGLSPKWSGALPATFVFDGGGTLRDFWEGKATYDTFAAKVRGLIEAPAGGTRG